MVTLCFAATLIVVSLSNYYLADRMRDEARRNQIDACHRGDVVRAKLGIPPVDCEKVIR